MAGYWSLLMKQLSHIYSYKTAIVLKGKYFYPFIGKTSSLTRITEWTWLSIMKLLLNLRR